MQSAPALQLDIVLTRTTRGQREVLVQAHDLDDLQRRLLLRVNGYTPLGTLVGPIRDDESLHRALRSLDALGLVEPAHPNAAD